MLNLSTYLMLRADVEGDIEKTVEATRCDNNTDNALFFHIFFFSDARITEKETDKGYDITSPILTFMLYHLSNARLPI